MKNPKSLNQMQNPKQEFSITHKIMTKTTSNIKNISPAKIKMYEDWET